MNGSIGTPMPPPESFASYEEADRLAQGHPSYWKVVYSFKKHAYVLKERNPSAN